MNLGQSIRELHPEGVDQLEKANEVARRTVDPALLDLCRRRIVEMVGAAASLETPDEVLSPRDRAHLEFTEQFVTSVSTIDAAQVDALLEYASVQQVYDFTCALYLIEMTTRACVVLESTVTTTAGNQQ
jgi:hypothetical protein